MSGQLQPTDAPQPMRVNGGADAPPLNELIVSLRTGCVTTRNRVESLLGAIRNAPQPTEEPRTKLESEACRSMHQEITLGLDVLNEVNALLNEIGQMLGFKI